MKCRRNSKKTEKNEEAGEAEEKNEIRKATYKVG